MTIPQANSAFIRVQPDSFRAFGVWGGGGGGGNGGINTRAMQIMSVSSSVYICACNLALLADGQISSPADGLISATEVKSHLLIPEASPPHHPHPTMYVYNKLLEYYYAGSSHTHDQAWGLLRQNPSKVGPKKRKKYQEVSKHK